MKRFGAIPSGTALESYLTFIEAVSLSGATPFKGGKVDDAIGTVPQDHQKGSLQVCINFLAR